ncbi:hypothetical protein CIK76_12770 [Glutamicibacter sp. BW80]|nr:hypothetical protein CIK76_12770 [Glutamicibacter sp. BW80]
MFFADLGKGIPRGGFCTKIASRVGIAFVGLKRRTWKHHQFFGRLNIEYVFSSFQKGGILYASVDYLREFIVTPITASLWELAA